MADIRTKIYCDRSYQRHDRIKCQTSNVVIERKTADNDKNCVKIHRKARTMGKTAKTKNINWLCKFFIPDNVNNYGNRKPNELISKFQITVLTTLYKIHAN